MSNAGQIKVLDAIQGGSFLAIRDAMSVLERHKLESKHHRITVVRDGSSIFVLFSDNAEAAASNVNIAVQEGNNRELSAAELDTLLSNQARLTTLDTMQSANFAPIQAAMTAFQRYNPDLSNYKIELVRERDSVVVIFTDKDAEPGGRGNPGRRPGFEVELDIRDLRVLRANFIR